ncbi:MAG: RNA polymerase sigma factor [Bacteroidota bacterium]|nr:RNA polymerase sigma factor [Bacteroidota bacterium]
MALLDKQKELDLIARLKNKNAEAFNELYELSSSLFFGVIFKMVKRQDLAEDILHDAYLKIWSHIGSYDEERASLFTWMNQIIHNTALDALRSKYNKGIQNIENSVYYENEPSSQANISHIGVKDIVQKLKPEWQAIIELVYFKGMTHEEASETLQIPLGTLKTRVRRALQELKHIFSN